MGMEFSLDDDRPTGNCHLYYSEPGKGKTSIFPTVAAYFGKPIKVYYAEIRDPKQTLYAAYPELVKGDDRVKIDFFHGNTFDEYMDNINQLGIRMSKGERPYAAIGFDSLSFIQQHFKLDMEDDRFKDSVAKDKRGNALIDRFRIEMADWGGLGSMMQRLTFQLQKFSARFGIPVICMATLAENPKYNQILEAGPAFTGKAYAESFSGYFDFIGLVKQSDKQDKPWPPHVFYVSKFDDFVAKCTSRTLREKQEERGYIPFDFRIIQKLIDKDKE